MKRNLLSVDDLTREDIERILGRAESFAEVSGREIKKVPTLRGRTVINLFYEASTRTRTSFELAGKRLSADVINISASSSSAVKGETLLDTVKNLEAMHPDVLVIRHYASGAPHFVAARTRAARACGSTGTPSSLAYIMRIRSSGRGRLPVCVVRKRSVLRFIGSSRAEL